MIIGSTIVLIDEFVFRVGARLAGCFGTNFGSFVSGAIGAVFVIVTGAAVFAGWAFTVCMGVGSICGPSSSSEEKSS